MSGSLFDHSGSSLKGSIGSASGIDHMNLQSGGLMASYDGARLVQELADHLNALTSTEEKKKLMTCLLQPLDDDCLAILHSLVETEKKQRRKTGKKDSKENLKKKDNKNNGKDPDLNSNGNNSIGSSSMEAIPESSGTQPSSCLPQTSPTPGSRKTFAGVFRQQVLAWHVVCVYSVDCSDHYLLSIILTLTAWYHSHMNCFDLISLSRSDLVTLKPCLV